MNETKIEFEPVRLVCCDCRQPFVFSAGERAFFWSKGLSTPKRCPQCRQKRKATLVLEEGSYDNG